MDRPMDQPMDHESCKSMTELESRYGLSMTPKGLADFLGVDARTVIKYAHIWGGVEVAPGTYRFFENRIMAEKPLTLQELGDKYHISRERVRQIQEKIIKNIKKWLKEEIPDFEEQYADFLK